MTEQLKTGESLFDVERLRWIVKMRYLGAGQWEPMPDSETECPECGHEGRLD